MFVVQRKNVFFPLDFVFVVAVPRVATGKYWHDAILPTRWTLVECYVERSIVGLR